MPSPKRPSVKTGAKGPNLGVEGRAARSRSKTARPSPTAASASNLPARLSSFVARERETGEISSKVQSDRLVTVTGAPGVGKTSLVLQVAGLSSGSFEDGAWLVELAGITGRGLVVQAVASALKIGQQAGGSLADSLVSHLASRRLLLVLDNCEHVIGECATLIDLLLKSCPRLSVLATSQETLGLAGETVYQLPPLSVPGPHESSPQKLMSYQAVRLFTDRAQGVKSGFALDRRTGPVVAEICRRLDGIPLAIELAAARVAMLSPAEILERLDDRFRLLTGGDRAALPRHRALRTALEWSYGLLTDKEQLLLRRLSVFSGGFTLAAAERVCSSRSIPPDRVFDLVERLQARSLVVGDPAGRKTRFRLLETVREFGKKKLSTRERDSLSEKHAEWAIELAEEAQAGKDTPRENESASLLDIEHKNLRSALEWCFWSGRTELAIRLTVALSWFWLLRGHFTEGRQWLEAALSETQAASDEQRASVLSSTGSLATFMGDSREALPMLEESLSLYRGLDDRAATIGLLKMIGMNQLFLHDPPTALPNLQKAVEEARQQARELGEPAVLVAQLGACARAYLFHGELSRARQLFEEARGLAEKAEDPRRVGDSLAGIGWTLMLQGEYRSAEKHVTEGLKRSRQAGDAYGTALALSFAGELAALQGRHRTARRLLDEGLETARLMGAPFPQARSLAGLGRVALDQGRTSRAVQFFEDALAALPAAGPKYFVPYCLAGLAEAEQAAGDLERAAALADEALARAEENKDAWSTAVALYCHGATDELRDKLESSGRHYHQALELQMKIGDRAGAADSLEGLGGLAVDTERQELAVRLFAFCDKLREELGYPRRGPRISSFETSLARLRAVVPKKQFLEAWEQGNELSLEQAVAQASRGRGSRGRPAVGWASLTPAELEVVSQVAAGLTNREIADHLFISPRTVEAHLSQIFNKLGTKSRREVAKQAELNQG